MAESKYIAIIKAQLDAAGIQGQLDKQLAAKPLRLHFAKPQGSDTQAIDAQIKLWENKIKNLSINKPSVFKNADVQKEVSNLENLFVGYRKGTVSIEQMKVAFSDLSVASNKAQAALQLTAKGADNFGTTLIKDIGKMVIWAAAATAIYGSLRLIGNGVQYIKDLDKELTNIGMVTGQTQERLSGMAIEFNAMARELGVTTLSVAKGATEWIRQGKTAAETTELLRSSTMMSKLGNLEAADATDKLIAVTNAYNISAKDSIDVVSTLVALDNSFATSTAEISEGMQKSASMAKLAGVSYKDLASYITVISATTRQSGETIGQAMKTIFARMEQVKAGAKIDDEGEAINNVEKVLLKNGIALRDNANQFRDMSDVLQDVAVRYKELGLSGNTVAQQQIVGAIAGKNICQNL